MFSLFINGISKNCLRSSYPPNTVNAEGSNGTNNYSGQYISQSNDNSQKKYVIDDVIEVNIISDNIAKPIKMELIKWGIIMVVLTLCFGIVMMTMVWYYFFGIFGLRMDMEGNYLVGYRVVMFFFVGCFYVGIFRIKQIAGQIKAWNDKIENYVAVRRNLRKTTHHNIYVCNYVRKYLTEKEGNLLWMNSVYGALKRFTEYFENSEYELGIDIETIISRHPLEHKYVIYFELEQLKRTSLSFSDDCVKIIASYRVMKHFYDKTLSQNERNKENEIHKIDKENKINKNDKGDKKGGDIKLDRDGDGDVDNISSIKKEIIENEYELKASQNKKELRTKTIEFIINLMNIYRSYLLFIDNHN